MNNTDIINQLNTLADLTSLPLSDLIKDALGGNLTEEDVRSLLLEHERNVILDKYTFPKKPDKEGYYRVYVKDPTASGGRKQLRDRNIDNLKEKVVCHEKGTPFISSVITFKDAFEYAQSFDQKNVSKDRQYSKNNTVSKRNSDYKRFFANTSFELLPIDKITLRDLDSIIRSTLRKHELTKKGMESVRSVINLTFKRAAFMGWTEDNPASKIIWSDYRKMLYVPPSIKDRAYTTAELHEMDEYLLKHQTEKPWYIPAYAIEFQKITGARRGEIPPLLWEDVDFEKGTIFFHRELISQQNKQTESEYICDYTKNGTARYYPIADIELEFLSKLKKVHDQYYPDSPYLFPYPGSKHGCITNNMAYQFFRRMCKKLGIPVSRDKIRGTHALRRNAITEVVNNSNGNCVLTAQMFGNSPETIRKHYYVGENIEELRAILNLRSAT